MSLPSNSQKLNKTQIESIENAVKDVGIKAIHPDKMEAFAEYLVEKLSYDEQTGTKSTYCPSTGE